jgi:hypothetical protein
MQMKKYSIHLFWCVFICLYSININSQNVVAKSFQRIVVRDANFDNTGWQSLYKDLVYIGMEDVPEDSKWPEAGNVVLTKDDTQKDKTVPLTNKNFDGLELRAITELKYSTCVINCLNIANPVAPALLLQVDLNGDHQFTAGTDGTINYFPQFQVFRKQNGGEIFPVVMNNWQEWNALLGKWRFGPGLLETNIPDFGKNSQLFRLRELLDYYRSNQVDVTIINDINKPDIGGGIKFVLPSNPPANLLHLSAGDYNQYKGCVDGIIISTRPLGISIDPSSRREVSYDFQFTYYGFKYSKPIIVIITLAFVFGLFIYYKRKKSSV